MRNILMLSIALLCANAINAMQKEIEELYKLCQQYFHDSQIRNIAFQINEINERKGSYLDRVGAFQVRSASAVASYDVTEQNVIIHKLDFPGVPQEKHLTKISFSKIPQIVAYIEVQNKK